MIDVRVWASLVVSSGITFACTAERPSDESVADESGAESSDGDELPTTGPEGESTGPGTETETDDSPETETETETETDTDDPIPTTVAIDAGHTHTCALADDGQVKCWGHGIYGQLGQADTASIGDDETPLAIHAINLGGPAVQVATGSGYTCALMVGGTVRCWGFGGYGALGYGNIETIGDDETPASAGDVDVGGTVVQITTGEGHTCARLDDGAVRCWGYGMGLLGYVDQSDIGNDETPASAGDVPLGGPATWISAGRTHTCAVLDAGNVRCWGNGFAGELGYGNLLDIGDDETPEAAGDVPIGVEVAQVEVSYANSCALTITGAVRCWGDGQVGANGYGTTQNLGDDEFPSTAGDVDVGGGAVVELTLGYNGFTCARLELGELRCWGNNFFGALGLAHMMNIGDDELPTAASEVDLGGTVTDVAAGDTHVCALLEDGAVHCWGDSQFGALGYGNLTRIGDDETPASAGAVEVW